MRAVADELLTLRGPPSALDGVLPGFSWAEASEVPDVSLDAPGGERPVAAFVTLPDSTSMVGLRLVLPDGTPPGSYRGTLRLGKREIRLEAEVGSDAALTLIPGTVRAVGASGGTVSAGLTAVNTGNVAVALPERQGVGLFTTQGLDRALGRALSGTAERGLEHFEALGSALADEHGGIMEVRTDGGGALAPGQTRAITIEMSPPSSLRAGETYFGFWLAGGSRVQIELQTQEAEPEEEPR